MEISNVWIRFPNGRAKALTLSYDDGVREDDRLIDIMQRYGLRGTFNLNTGRYLTEEQAETMQKPYGIHKTEAQATQAYSGEGIEPAVHGYSHAFMGRLPLPQLTYEVLKDREALERQFGRVVRGLAYPSGSYSDSAVEVLRACGIAYARTTQSTEKFDIPTDWLRMPATCHHNSARLSELTERFVESQPKKNEHGWLFYLWGHSYEFARDDNWNVIEQFAARIGGRDDVWYATNIEVYQYVESFRRLVFSLDCSRIENPSAQTVWFLYHSKVYSVAPGEVLELS